jgi:hypothetical protein
MTAADVTASYARLAARGRDIVEFALGEQDWPRWLTVAGTLYSSFVSIGSTLWMIVMSSLHRNRPRHHGRERM